MGFVQIISDKIGTTLRTTALVAFPVPVTPLNVSVRKKHWLIEGGYTVVRFLPVSSREEEMDVEGNGEKEGTAVYGFTSFLIMPFESEVRATPETVARERRMRVLQEAMKVVLRPLRECGMGESVVKTRQMVECKCVPLIVS